MDQPWLGWEGILEDGKLGQILWNLEITLSVMGLVFKILKNIEDFIARP